MKIINSQEPFSFGKAIIFLIAVVLFATTVHAGQGSLKGLRGPAFDDPSKEFPMPEKWREKPVHHSSENSDADVIVSLDGQMFLAWEPIIQRFAEKNNLKIVTNRGTCGVSAGGLVQKKIDIGTFCCPAGETDRLPGLKFHTAGIAAIALLVHTDNPVDSVTIEQARNIFRGRIYQWSEIDDSKKTDFLIRPVARLHCKLRPGHWRLLLDNKEIFSPDLFEVGAMPDMISQVAVNPGAIGYEVPWVTQLYRNRGNVKFLKINGYSPDELSHVISGEYPIYRVYNFTTWEGKHLENPHAQELMNYILEQVEHLDGKYHIIPASSLRKAGWKFRDSELTGEPE